jgi:hypothetical protein
LILGATYLLNKKFIHFNDITSSVVDKNTEEAETKSLPITTKEQKSTKSRKNNKSGKQEVANIEAQTDLNASLETEGTDGITNTGVAESSISENVTDNIQEERIGTNNIEETASGPSTLELLEQQNHANVVKDAKRAGVSTEGTTLEILDRIQHANVVKDAKRAGVSTEGTTLEILDRIQHANVVKDAKRAGVSTEGTIGE